MKKKQALLIASFVVVGLTFWGCKDGNIFGGLHSSGSGDSVDLLATGQSALANREFSNARASYESILAKDPGNSEALYGAAVATMGTAGLDVGQLLANVVASNGAPSAATLQSEIQAAAFGVSAVAVDPRSLLNGINIDRLDEVLDRVICYLVKIRVGATDGTISKDDISVLVGLGITCLLRAAIRPLNAGLIDIVSSPNGESYDVVVKNPGGLAAQCSLIEASASDIAGAYQALKEAAAALKQVTGDTLFDMPDDLSEALTELRNDVVAVAPACATALDAVIAALNADHFTTNPGDCLTQ